MHSFVITHRAAHRRHGLRLMVQEIRAKTSVGVAIGRAKEGRVAVIERNAEVRATCNCL